MAQGDEKRRNMTIGVALFDSTVVPRFCVGCFYSQLKIEGVVALEAALKVPEVAEAYDVFMEKFGDAAAELGLEAALDAGADPAKVGKIVDFKKKKGGGPQGRKRPGQRG